MRLTTFDNLEVGAGRLHRWTITSTGGFAPHPTGPSENERFHLDAVRQGGSGWLAVTFEIDTATVDLERMARAFADVLDHHEILRAHFSIDSAGEVHRHLHARGAFGVHHSDSFEATDADDCKQMIRSAITDGCCALTPASHVLAAVEHRGSTTVVCAFDHCYVDAHSLAIIAEDLRSTYSGRTLEPAGSFLDHQAVATTVGSTDGDPRVAAWHDFLVAADWQVPEFPIDLGVEPGGFAPARILVRTVLTDADAAVFATLSADRGVRFYPALLACLAHATRNLGGPVRLPLILPVHTRRTDRWSRSVGWFVANAPLLLEASSTDGSDLTPAMRSATDALAAALPLAEVDLTTVYGTFGHRMTKSRHDVFMVSYLDYRRFDRLPSMNVHHVSSDGRADTLQLWFWRDEAGVHLRTRYPDTDVGRHVVEALTADLIRIAHEHLRVGRARMAPATI